MADVKKIATRESYGNALKELGEQVDNRYLGKTLSLTVTAQAVQSQNNPIADGLIYTAAGWPAE